MQDDFEKLKTPELRAMLSDEIQKAVGVHFLVEWLNAVYIAGHAKHDYDRDWLIEQIILYREMQNEV